MNDKLARIQSRLITKDLRRLIGRNLMGMAKNRKIEFDNYNKPLLSEFKFRREMLDIDITEDYNYSPYDPEQLLGQGEYSSVRKVRKLADEQKIDRCVRTLRV